MTRKWSVRFAKVIVGVLIYSAPAPGAIETEIFINTFDLAEMCAWSSLSTPCVPETAIEAFLNSGDSIPFCVLSTSAGFEVCTTEMCAGSPGCPATMNLVAGSAGFSWPHLSLDVTFDDLDAPVIIQGLPCTVQMRDATGTSARDLGGLICSNAFPGEILISDVPAANLFAAATLSMTGSPACPLLNGWQGPWINVLETSAEPALAQYLRANSFGEFLCQPAP